jgi:hypothetical protein
MAIISQMDTIKASNKGYSADLLVVTFNSMKETVDNGSKVHVLLVSFQPKFPCSFFPALSHTSLCLTQLPQD